MVKRNREEEEAPSSSNPVHSDAHVPKRVRLAEVDSRRTTQTSEEKKFRQRIKEVAKPIPRFLFRFWSERSGGDKRLNTIDAITPRAFLGSNGPTSLYKMDPSSVQELAQKHVCGDNCDTVFSSWSQSLAFVLCHARELAMSGYVKNTHISILDTSRLDEANIILHTSEMSNLFRGRVDPYYWEYLVFGVLRGGEICRAVSYDYFEPPRMRTEHGNALSHILAQPNVEVKIKTIKQVAQRFGAPLEVAMAAHMMGFARAKDSDDKKYLADLVSAMPIPAAWATDESIMRPNVNYHGMEECNRADKMLQRMVAIKHPDLAATFMPPQSVTAANQATPAGPKPKSAKTPKKAKKAKATAKAEDTPDTFKKAKKTHTSMSSSTRVPKKVRKSYHRMVKECYIGLDGWDDNNKEIKTFLKSLA